MGEHKRFASFAELRGVVRYEWSMRHAWRGWRAAVRGLWWTFARNYAFETCTCGRRVAGGIGETFWRAPDELWLRVMGSEHGVLCPGCFTERAEARGIEIFWQPVEWACTEDEVCGAQYRAGDALAAVCRLAPGHAGHHRGDGHKWINRPEASQATDPVRKAAEAMVDAANATYMGPNAKELRVRAMNRTVSALRAALSADREPVEITDEMIERAARALCDPPGWQPRYDSMPEEFKDEIWRKKARHALSAAWASDARTNPQSRSV